MKKRDGEICIALGFTFGSSTLSLPERGLRVPFNSTDLHFCERRNKTGFPGVPPEAFVIYLSPPHSIQVTVVAVVVPPGPVVVVGAVSAAAVVVAVEGRERLVVVGRHGRVAGVA